MGWSAPSASLKMTQNWEELLMSIVADGCADVQRDHDRLARNGLAGTLSTRGNENSAPR